MFNTELSFFLLALPWVRAVISIMWRRIRRR